MVGHLSGSRVLVFVFKVCPEMPVEDGSRKALQEGKEPGQCLPWLFTSREEPCGIPAPSLTWLGGLLFSIHTCRILQDPSEGLMLKLKRQYFGHLMRRTDSSEKTLMLGKIEGRRRRG